MLKKTDFIYDPSLALYLPLWKLDGSSFMSKDAHGHLCTVDGVTWGLRGRDFANNSTDAISCGSAAALDNIAIITYEVWLYTHSVGVGGGTNRLFDKGVGAAAKILGISSDAVLRNLWFYQGFSVTAGQWRTTNEVITLNTWQHMVLTYDRGAVGNDPVAYTNGVSVAITEIVTPDGAASTDAGNLIIGNNASVGGSRSYDGILGEVRIYNRTLSPPEVQYNYLATKFRYQ